MADDADPQFLEHAEDILAYVQDCQRNAVPCALCVVTNVSGGSARSVGTLVAVRADGKMAGYVSHGCVDADLRLQAQAAIEAAQPRQLVYGVGSPFMDLQLPCGGTVEVLVDPAPDPGACALVLQQLQTRQPIALNFTGEAGLVSAQPQQAHTGWMGNTFTAWHPPALQLIVAGTGPLIAAVTGISKSMRLPIFLLSPDPAAEDQLAGSDRANFVHLKTQDAQLELPLDNWTAVLLLFHDHDWEVSLLQAALQGNPCYIGALGSSRTHHQRLATLKELGMTDKDLARITGPIGIIPAARDAHTLALSALAEVIDTYRQMLALDVTPVKPSAIAV